MKIRVSAVNWDCSLPSSTFFGYFQTRTLSPKKYRTATPYYADVLEENKIDYHVRGQEEFDRELQYAIDAGIDYFSFVFYPDAEALKASPCEEGRWENAVCELNAARLLYQSSELKSKIGMALIIGASDHYERDYKEIARLTCEPYYEKIDGRPIIYLFSNKREYVEGVRRAVKEIGGKEPLFFAMYGRVPENAELDFVDGLSSYASGICEIESYSQLLDGAMAENLNRAEKGMPTIPLFPIGGDPSPRIDKKSPWVSYQNCSYAKAATPAELLDGGRRFAKWIKDTPSMRETFCGHILMFAWNEFEEGGWICPTYNEDLSVNTDRISAISELSEYWKNNL
jgi:hypothetical protein